jgi:chemotaxis response regulator CheB
MRRIRVLLVEVPGVLSGILRDVIGHEPDMEVVGELKSSGDLMPAIRRTEADFLIWGLQPVAEAGGVPEACSAVLDAHPRIKVLAVEADGRSGSLYELRPWRLGLGELAPARIVEILRTHPRLAAAQAS